MHFKSKGKNLIKGIYLLFFICENKFCRNLEMNAQGLSHLFVCLKGLLIRLGLFSINSIKYLIQKIKQLFYYIKNLIE